MPFRRSHPSPARSLTTRHRPGRLAAPSALALAAIVVGAVLTPAAASAAPQTAEVAPSTSAWFHSVPGGAVPDGALPSGALPSGALPALPLVTTPLVVTGAHAVGQTLTVTALWEPSPIAFSYQWKRGSSSISKATKASYTLTKSDAGQHITVVVTGVKTGYTTAKMTSASIHIQKLLTATPIPTMTGHAAPGYTMTAHPGIWKPSPVKASYAWMIGGVVVGMGSTYKIRPQDAGQWIAIWVTGSKSSYTSVTRMSLSRLIAGTVVTS